MGWRGLTRSLGALARQVERDRRRQQRQEMRQALAVAQHVHSMQVGHLIAQYEAALQRLLTVHTRGSQGWNWHAVVQTPAPAQPLYMAHAEQQAVHRLHSHVPSLTARALGEVEQERQLLAHDILVARERDRQAHAAQMHAWQARHDTWSWHVGLGQALLDGELDANRAALEYLLPVGSMPELCGELRIESDVTWCVEATILLRGDDDLFPEEHPVQLKSGAVSWKRVPVSRYNEMYQDYVCSCLLRVAWETLALLPIAMTFVHATSMRVDGATGYQEPTTLVSAAIPRETLFRLNMQQLDPSKALRNFAHNIDFSPRSGLRPVAQLRISDFAPRG